jgi:hypothetical protein
MTRGGRWGARGFGLAACVAALGPLTGTACGDGDVTTLTGPESESVPLEPESGVEDSRTFAVLSAPESLDAVCRFIGVSSMSGSGSNDPQACSEVVEECRGNLSAALGTSEPMGLGLPQADLEPLFGCPLTLAQLDACIGAVLERSIEEYGGSLGCEMPALPAVDTIRLFASADCIAVAFQCPELIASLIAPPSPPPPASELR